MDILFADGREEISTDDLYDHIYGDMDDLADGIRKSDRVKLLFNLSLSVAGPLLREISIDTEDLSSAVAGTDRHEQ